MSISELITALQMLERGTGPDIKVKVRDRDGYLSDAIEASWAGIEPNDYIEIW